MNPRTPAIAQVYADLVRADRSGEDLRVHRVMKYASFFEELGLTR